MMQYLFVFAAFCFGIALDHVILARGNKKRRELDAAILHQHGDTRAMLMELRDSVDSIETVFRTANMALVPLIVVWVV